MQPMENMKTEGRAWRKSLYDNNYK